jgi:hypothetical protein
VHVLHLDRSQVDQRIAMAPDRTQSSHLVLGVEGAAQQPYRVQVLQPLAILYIALASGNVLLMMCIDQAYA